MAKLIRVAIVDDHPATASGLAALLVGQPGLAVVGTAGTLPEAIELVEREMPEVALVDIQLDGQPFGFDLLARVARTGGPGVILFSTFDYSAFHARALELGARGYLSKTASLAEIIAAIRTVAAGGTAFAAAALDDATHVPRLPSERELDVIRLLVAGRSNSEIAGILRIGTRGIESHLRRLFGRYGVQSRTELAMLAVRMGWVSASGAPQ